MDSIAVAAAAAPAAALRSVVVQSPLHLYEVATPELCGPDSLCSATRCGVGRRRAARCAAWRAVANDATRGSAQHRNVHRRRPYAEPARVDAALRARGASSQQPAMPVLERMHERW
jgi:hypothetical protein